MSVQVLESIREQAAQRFEQLGWPTPRLESWKYTNLAQAAKVQWKTAPDAATVPLSGTAGDGLRPVATFELRFVNGRFADMTGRVPDGVRILRFSEAQDDAVFAKHFAKYADYQNHAFTALNTAFGTWLSGNGCGWELSAATAAAAARIQAAQVAASR